MRSERLLKWAVDVTWTVVFVGGKLTPGNEGRLPWRRPLAVNEFVLGTEKPLKLGLNEKGGW